MRKELAAGAAEPRTPADAGYQEGLYRRETTAATYAAMLERARVALRRGQSVVLDASWTSEERRHAARQVAAETRAETVEVACVVASSEAHRRIEARRVRGDDLSDATVEVARALAADADPWPSARRIDTSGSKREALRHALDALPVSGGEASSNDPSRQRRSGMENRATAAAADIHASVGSLTLRPVLTVPEDASLREVSRRLEEANVSSAVVGDEPKVGRFVTERDLTRAMAHQEGPEDSVGMIATQGPVWVTPDTSLLEAAEVMVRHEVRHLLVILPVTGEAVGVVSMRDVFPVLLQAAEGLPSTSPETILSSPDSAGGP